ncbi:hypothetical protein [Paenibacillus sp. GYB003]|uniref:hypothetical protein n=1 Tax=Paenibacillus sp. GYB003 TaxID=2994392 RepID=UPI002F961DE4
MSFIWGMTVDGWFFSPKFQYYQKCAGRVVCYVEQMTFMHRLVLYPRGKVYVCSLEARTGTGVDPDVLFHMGESWLRQYASADEEQIHKDIYAVNNLEGVWGPFLAPRRLFYLDPHSDVKMTGVENSETSEQY